MSSDAVAGVRLLIFVQRYIRVIDVIPKHVTVTRSVFNLSDVYASVCACVCVCVCVCVINTFKL